MASKAAKRGRPRRTMNDQYGRIIELAKDFNLTYSDIAAEVNVTIPTVGNVLKDLAPKLHRNRKLVRAFHTGNYTQKELATKFAVSQALVSRLGREWVKVEEAV